MFFDFSVPPLPEPNRETASGRVEHDVIRIASQPFRPIWMLWENNLEHHRPDQHRNHDFMNQRRQVVTSQAKFACDEQQDRHQKRNADQVVEMAIKELMVRDVLNVKSIHPVEYKACEEQRVFKVTERHRSMPTWNMKRQQSNSTSC